MYFEPQFAKNKFHEYLIKLFGLFHKCFKIIFIDLPNAYLYESIIIIPFLTKIL